MRVERVTDPERLPELAAAWDDLIEDDHPGAAFRSSAWLVPWWRHFGTGKHVCIYLVRRERRIVGVLPAYRVQTRLGYCQLRLMGDGKVGSDYLGVVARRADLEVVSESLARALLAEEADLVFEGVPADEPLVASLQAAAQAHRLPCATASMTSCPVARLGNDFESWLRHRPQGAGTQLQRRLRWLQRQPGFRIEVLEQEAEIAAALPGFWRLHQAAWAQRGGSTLEVDSAATVEFHTASALALARRGWARLFILHVAGAARAGLYGFERGGRFAYYQSGYDPHWRQRAVGRAILGVALEHAFERGLTEFDFLRGDEEYKSLFASGRRELVRLRVATCPPAAAAWGLDQGWTAVKSLALGRLSPSRREWARQCRRRVLRWATQRGGWRDADA